MNFVLAFVVLCGFYLVTGVGVYDPYLSAIEEDGALADSGLQAYDIVISVNGTDVRDGTATTLTGIISSWQPGDAPLCLTVERRGETGSEILEAEA